MGGETVKIAAVGDIFLGEHPYTLGHGVASKVREKGCPFLFSKARDLLSGADILCANLEGIISPRNENEAGIRSAIFWGDPSCAEALKEAGFNCLFLANNHTIQHGRDALDRTCRTLERSDIRWSGYDPEAACSSKPALFTVNGIKVGLSAYCETQQYLLDTPILPPIDPERIRMDIKDLRAGCDIVVVSLHWGEEFILYPSPNQVRMARELIDSGAHLVLGHHSHTLQPFERYKNGLIAYSLGSFVKDLWQVKLRESAVLTCELSKSGVVNHAISPVFINREYQPEPYCGAGRDALITRLDAFSKAIDAYRPENHEELQKKYEDEALRLQKKDKMETAWHYLSNIHRYDRKLLAENIFLMIKRRVGGKNL